MNEYLYENIEKILNQLNIEYNKYHNRITFCCPLHGSDNNESLSILMEGENINGIWTCWTNHCEKQWGKNLFGLIKGIISIQINKDIDNKEIFNWIQQKIGQIPTNNLSLDNYLKIVSPKEEIAKGIIDRNYVRKNLIRPAESLIKRNFPSELLDKYDIGICCKKSQMFTRTVIPVYDINYEYMVGCLGRTNNPKCEKCNLYHQINRACPSNLIEKRWSAKWINSKFYSGNYLFNIWFAKSAIYDTGTIILVEGPLDVLRLEHANIHNSVALFGSNLTDSQHEILNSLPIHTLIIATDNDESGKIAREKINMQTKRYFNIKNIEPIQKDWAEHSSEEIKKIFKNNNNI